MNIGLGIGIPFTRSSLWASIFTPSALFLDGSTQGVWYDPSDINLTWRRNLLTYSEQFDNTVWDKTSFPVMITADVIAAPNGTNTVDLVVPTAASAAHAVRQTGLSVGTSASFSVYAKSAGYDRVQLYLQNTGGFGHITFSLASGTVTNTVSGSVTVTGSITSAGNGWYLLSVAGAGATTVSTVGISPLDAGANGATLGPTYTGNGTSGIYTWGAQLEQGSTATPYQRITDGIQDYLQYQPLPVMYQDAAGTLPVTAVEQPVGLMLDKSKGLVLGPELVTNGDFSNGTTGWVAYSAIAGGAISNSSNTLLVSNNSGTYARGVSALTGLTVGKTYQATGVCLTASHGAVVRVSTASDAASGYVYNNTTLAVGPIKFVFTANATTLYIAAGVESATQTATATFDNISVRELPGNHAFNPSGNSANFPVLSARYNLLTNTELLTGAAWTKTAGVTVTDNAAIAPDGTMTASTIAFGASNREIAQSFSATATTTIPTFYVKGTAGQVLNFGTAGLNLSITLTGGWDIATSTLPAGITKFYIGNFAGNANALNISIWHPDLRVANDGVNLPAYQRVNTATDYDSSALWPRYLRFNGTNQWLQTNSIDFTYGDKMFVCAGVRKLSDAAIGILLETSNAFDTTSGVISIAAPSTGAYKYGITVRGTVTSAAASTDSQYASPITNILSSIGNISGDQAILRVNGTQVATSTSDQGTGNFGNYPLYIGSRAGSSLWFNGRLYQLVIAAGSEIRVAEEDSDLFLSESGDFITAETTVAVIQSAIEQTEAFVNRKTSAF